MASLWPSTTMPFDRRRRRLSSTATQTTRYAIRRNTVTALKTTTSPTIFASTASLSLTGELRSGASSRPIITASGSATRDNMIVAIVLAVLFVLALVATFKLHYVWRRRAARRRNSTFIQYPFYTDAAPGRMSVVPRDELLVPPAGPREWDARSAAASSTAATFDSPIGASEFHHGHDRRPPREVQSLDEKLRDIFYPAAHAGPRSSASFVPSFSSPASVSAPRISPPPPAAHAQLPSFVPEPAGSPQAWRDPPPSPGYPARTPGRVVSFPVSQSSADTGFRPRTPGYGPGGGGDRRPPSYTT